MDNVEPKTTAAHIACKFRCAVTPTLEDAHHCQSYSPAVEVAPNALHRLGGGVVLAVEECAEEYARNHCNSHQLPPLLSQKVVYPLDREDVVACKEAYKVEEWAIEINKPHRCRGVVNLRLRHNLQRGQKSEHK